VEKGREPMNKDGLELFKLGKDANDIIDTFINKFSGEMLVEGTVNRMNYEVRVIETMLRESGHDEIQIQLFMRVLNRVSRHLINPRGAGGNLL
jgi:hypothetical protein